MTEYRPMRRSERAMPPEDARAFLEAGETGVLSTVGPDNQPYGVPLSYVMIDGAIYFHGATTGHKIDNLAHQPSVSFCVVSRPEAFYDKDFTTTFESVVVFGQAVPVEEEAEKRRALLALCEKYLPEHMDKAQASIDASLERTAVIRMSVDHLTGKRRVKP